jgi:hypothetical protein
LNRGVWAVVIVASGAALHVPVSSASESHVASRAPGKSPTRDDTPSTFPTCPVRAVLAEAPGKDGPVFTLTLTNVGGETLRLVEPNDGSHVGRRTPALRWFATTPDGRPGERHSLPRCGVMDPVEVRHIFTLAPGESQALRVEALDESYVPGTYDARLRYQNRPDPAPAAAREADRLLATTTHCEVMSNAIRSTVTRRWD